VVHSTTYYHYNPWYKTVLYKGEEGHVLTSAPVGHTLDELPDGIETVEFDGDTYYYESASFYQAVAEGGYIVVEPPAGAEVSSIPEESEAHEEGDSALYQFGNAYFSKNADETGKTVYKVEPAPPEEELTEIPAGSLSFDAAEETYYYVNHNLYVEYDENGKTGYVNGEPEIGAQLDTLPSGTTTIEEGGKTFYQFDMVFFEEVEGDDGTIFYEVVDSPDGGDVVELEND